MSRRWNEALTVLQFVDGEPRLAVDVAGSGPPVVFLHGIGGNRSNWARQVSELATSFTCYTWDARGYGDSDDYDGPLDFSDFGNDLARLLDHFDIERAHLVGLSMGARILLDFAPRHLERVATLTLCDCFYGFANALSPEKQREYIELRERPLLEGKTFADLAPRLVESLVSADCPPPIRQELSDSILQLRAESYLKTLRASTTFDQKDTIHVLDMPVKLIFGGEDRLTPPELGYDMADMLTNADLSVLDGAGHLSNLEAPDAFNEVLGTFLNRYRDTASWRA